MIGEKAAKWMIACGWIAAGFAVVGGIYVSFAGPTVNFMVLAGALLFLGLGYGIYRTSRICAVVALVLFSLNRVGMYRVAAALQNTRGGNVMMGFWLSAGIFTMLYLLGVIGTITWHSRERGLITGDA
jgi:hypothetical protein